MTQEITEPGAPEPGPGTFSFDDYLAGNSTFPTFDHTVYLDQKSGAALGAVFAEIEELIDQQRSVEKSIEARSRESSGSLVDVQMDDLMGLREELDEKIRKALAKRDELNEKIISSGVTLTFQVKTAEELGKVSREAGRQFVKEHPHFKGATENDLEYITARSRYTITAQIAHFCIKMVDSQGREADHLPTRQQADSLLSSLISSEMMRLMEALGTGLSSSENWASKIDAGFPGGGPDMEELSLDQASAEDGPVLERASADDADRGPHGLVG